MSESHLEIAFHIVKAIMAFRGDLQLEWLPIALQIGTVLSYTAFERIPRIRTCVVIVFLFSSVQRSNTRYRTPFYANGLCFSPLVYVL